MASTIPVYKMEEVSPSDYHELAELEMIVFNDDPITVYAYGPERASPISIANRVRSLGSPPHGCTTRMRKVVDPDTGAIIGFSQWKFFYEPWIVNPPAEEEKPGDGDGDGTLEAKQEGGGGSNWPPPGANVELCERVFVRADEIREREFANKKHVALNILITLKSHQRRGIGKMLLMDGLEEADRHNLPCWLGSSEPGKPLYEKNGFVVDEVLEFDMRPYGGDSTEKHIIMFRPGMGKVES